MFRINEGTLDRVLRIMVGLALLVWSFLDNGGGALHLPS
jgi:hypothetical protein